MYFKIIYQGFWVKIYVRIEKIKFRCNTLMPKLTCFHSIADNIFPKIFYSEQKP